MVPDFKTNLVFPLEVPSEEFASSRHVGTSAAARHPPQHVQRVKREAAVSEEQSALHYAA